MREMFDDSVFKVLKKSLDTYQLRHKVIAENIANVDTPHYKKAFVTFEDELKKALSEVSGLRGVTTHPGHIPIPSDTPRLDEVQGRTFVENDYNNRVDKNNVDLEEEMANLSRNTILFNIYSQLLSTKYKMYADVIGERA
jgi:flagellar basal-body rod protein FlgB